MLKLVVLSCVLAMAASAVVAPVGFPYGWGAPWAAPWAATWAAPWVAPGNYRGPLSLAPGQPANVVAADGRPLDTLDVNLDRSAHLTAKVVDATRLHVLKKRAAALVAPLAVNHVAVAHAPLAYTAHVAPVARLTYAHAPIFCQKTVVPTRNIGPDYFTNCKEV